MAQSTVCQPRTKIRLEGNQNLRQEITIQRAIDSWKRKFTRLEVQYSVLLLYINISQVIWLLNCYCTTLNWSITTRILIATADNLSLGEHTGMFYTMNKTEATYNMHPKMYNDLATVLSSAGKMNEHHTIASEDVHSQDTWLHYHRWTILLHATLKYFWFLTGWCCGTPTWLFYKLTDFF